MKDGELDDSVIEESSATASDGKRYRTKFYNLDMIISVGYRVKSKRGIQFRRWATQVLKDYLLKGAAINERRIAALNKTVDIQTRILSGALSIDEKELSSVIGSYTKALDLLDDYQRLKTPETNKEIHSLTYEEARKIIDSMKFKENSGLFGVEKEKGKLNGIIQAINQSAFGEDIYPPLEEKAATFSISSSKTTHSSMGAKGSRPPSFWNTSIGTKRLFETENSFCPMTPYARSRS